MHWYLVRVHTSYLSPIPEHSSDFWVHDHVNVPASHPHRASSKNSVIAQTESPLKAKTSAEPTAGDTAFQHQ